MDDHHALLLAALHTSHELIQTQKAQAEKQAQLTQLIASLESKIQHTSKQDPKEPAQQES